MSLADEHCAPLRKGDPPLAADAAAALLAQLPGWSLEAEGRVLARRFEGFPSYAAGLAFATAVGALADAENHHPDLLIGYKAVELRWTTHAVGGLSRNDFICAAKADGLKR